MQKKHALLFLLISLLLPLAPGACSPAQVCLNRQSVSNLSVAPQGSACKSTCDCNNQRYEGFCNQGICVSRKRELCSTPGERDTCTLLPTPEAGLCRTGFKVCQPDYLSEALWGDCSVEKQPETDDACKDGIDNDCDGKTDSADSDCAATCTPGQQSICYTGAPATVNEGRCKSGLKTCQSDGTWSACLGERTPQPKDCSNGQDNDCDGSIDKNCEAKPEPSPDGGSGEPVPETTTDGEACSTGEFRDCYTGPAGTVGKGPCKTGQQTCTQGVWGPCSGEVTPQKEDCQNKRDDDCDGTVDNPKELGMPCTDTTQPDRCQGGIYICHPTSGKIVCKPVGETETCDQIDNDCDGVVDNIKAGTPCTDNSLPTGCQKGTYVCEAGKRICKPTGQPEICDEKDNDCDGKVDEGCVTTFAGTGVAGGQDGPRQSATLHDPVGLAFDSKGNLYIAETSGNRIRKIDTAGNVTTLLSATTTPKVNIPRGVAIDSKDNLYIADTGNDRILKRDTSGNVTIFAGTGKGGTTDGPRLSAQFDYPSEMVFDKAGNLFISDERNERIRKLDTAGNVTTIAGGGNCHDDSTTGQKVDCLQNGPGSQARFDQPRGLAFDSAGNLYLADSKNHRIAKLTLLNNQTCKYRDVVKGSTVEVKGYTGYCVTNHVGQADNRGNTDGPGDKAQFHTPRGLIFDKNDNLYIVASVNDTIRLVQQVTNTTCGNQGSYTGLCVTTFAGRSEAFADGPPKDARFRSPYSIILDKNGDIYLSDHENHRIRRYIFP